MDYIGKSGKGKEATAKAKTPRARTRARTKERAKMERALGKALTKECPMWDKGPGKKGKSNDKGGKGAKSGACHICGKMERYAKDCWKRVAG